MRYYIFSLESNQIIDNMTQNSKKQVVKKAVNIKTNNISSDSGIFPLKIAQIA